MALLCIAIACTLIMFIITFTFLIVGACCFDALYEMYNSCSYVFEPRYLNFKSGKDSAILEH